ncbi:hypothetical protein ACH5RR_015323 [Cinchona calisaya]|uniref:Uncharacterized protein n=1 Tax=Cinchona calisaya TaxID=153742 RepID=A0ABD2ZST7_9GENT
MELLLLDNIIFTEQEEGDIEREKYESHAEGIFNPKFNKSSSDSRNFTGGISRFILEARRIAITSHKRSPHSFVIEATWKPLDGFCHPKFELEDELELEGGVMLLMLSGVSNMEECRIISVKEIKFKNGKRTT